MFGKRSKSKNSLTMSKESLGVSHDSINGSREVVSSAYGQPSHSRHAGFSAHYLGAVTKFMMQQTPNKSSQAQLVEKIEQAQLDSRLLLKPTPADAVRLRLDRHGFQVAREDSDDIFVRIPLHTLAQLIQYEDGFGKHNLAVKVIVGRDLSSCHVFQCPTEEIAQSICETLQRVFRAIMAENITPM